MMANVGLPGLIMVLGLFAGPVFAAPGYVALEIAKPVPHPGAGILRLAAGIGQ